MKYISSNEELLRFLIKSYSLISSSINKIDLYIKDGEVCIDLYFKLMYSKIISEKELKISFIGVTEYSFYWNATHAFYNVERYKFFKAKSDFYISLDPLNEIGEITEGDQDIISSKSIEGYFI